jgi:putative transcriptional regulator
VVSKYNEEYVSIRVRLRELLADHENRTGKRLSIKQLARDTGLAESTLHNLANNTTQRFDAPILDTLCAYFDVSVGDLLVYEIEKRESPMTYTFPADGNEAISELKEHFPEIIREMPDEFTSHEFILRLAQRKQKKYIGGLAIHITNEAPFNALHTKIALALHDFPDFVEKIADNVESRNIFGDKSTCAMWRKKRPDKR